MTINEQALVTPTQDWGVYILMDGTDNLLFEGNVFDNTIDSYDAYDVVPTSDKRSVSQTV